MRNRSFVDEDYIFALEQELAISNGYPTYQDMCYDSAQKMINSLKERGLTPMDIGCTNVLKVASLLYETYQKFKRTV